MPSLKRFEDLKLAGKTALVRLDLNVPLRGGQVTDATRIERSLPTVRRLIEMGAKVIIAAHLGRPKGQVVTDLSLEPLVKHLADGLGQSVDFPSFRGGSVTLLENLRFNAGEEKNDQAFAAELAQDADLFVSDAFSCAHRAHASTVGVANHLSAYAGLLMSEEVTALGQAVGSGEKPVAALVGGAKVSTKLSVLENLVERVDHLIIGGGMANTFLAAQGLEIGTSLVEADLISTAQTIFAKAKAKGCALHLPIDARVTPAFDAPEKASVVDIQAVPKDQMILDIGPQSSGALTKLLDTCKTLLWNGPLGVFEVAPFDQGTVAVAQKAAALSKVGRMTSVAGGGDTVAALKHANALDDFSYVSTAGGAFLEWLEGNTLPGVAVLEA